MTKACFLIFAIAGSALPGWAALGGVPESAATDQVKLQAKRRIMPMQDYTVNEVSREDGGVIREYVTPAGKVFGVFWSGPTIPDLTQWLGSYHAEFQNTLRAHPALVSRRAAAVHNADLVVESSGYMRSFHGRAYLNSLLPSGVPKEAIK